MNTRFPHLLNRISGTSGVMVYEYLQLSLASQHLKQPKNRTILRDDFAFFGKQDWH